MLYIVGTPLGNLEDLSIRVAKTLLNADIILAENTSSIGRLLPLCEKMFGMQKNGDQRILPFAKEQEWSVLPKALVYIEDGKNVALVSEAGMPLISDPGGYLIKTLIKREFPFTIIPGPSAYTIASIASGTDTKNNLFVGFLPKKINEKKKIFAEYTQMGQYIKEGISITCYESPERLDETLRILNELYPDCYICIARELTKMHEEFLHGKPGNFLGTDWKGEVTLVISQLSI
jgi:16S rRNA (cytidine1402-2'-O)-methyltransferase